ncbi:MAG TPA: RNA polymerase sigma factor [Acidimicrobiales bacterium]|nr:RNA polymerase sigma factor [Acidimicrobiales bacterium]
MATRAPDYALEGESGDRERYLVLAHQAGDPFAFTEIVKDHYASLFAHALRKMGDQRSAEDVVQDSLLRAYKGLHSFSGDYNLNAWLHRIVNNVCADEGSRRQREARLAARFRTYADVVVPPVDEDIVDIQAAATVRAAVAELPDAYREALVLRDLMEMEYADVAEHIGISEQNARARVSRARAALRKLVAPTVPVFVFFTRAARRSSMGATRIAAKLTSQLTSAAGQATATASQMTAAAASAPPDVLAAPSRLAPAIGTLAATAVAAVASVGIPALVNSSHPAAPSTAATTATTAVAVVAGPQATGGPAGSPSALVVPAATVAPTTSTTDPAPTTTTAAPATATSTVSAPAVAVPTGGNATLALLTATSITTNAGGGSTEANGQLAVGPEPPSPGRLTTKLLLPTAAQPCSGALSATFVWGSTSPRSFEVKVLAVIVSAAHRNGAVEYSVRGTAQLVGGFGGLAGPLAVRGTFTVPDDGSDGQLGLTLTSGSGGSTPTCAVDPSVLPGAIAAPSTTSTSAPAQATTVVTSTAAA